MLVFRMREGAVLTWATRASGEMGFRPISTRPKAAGAPNGNSFDPARRVVAANQARRRTVQEHRGSHVDSQPAKAVEVDIEAHLLGRAACDERQEPDEEKP